MELAGVEWWPGLRQRNPGRPKARWVDDTVKNGGNIWMEDARLKPMSSGGS